MKAYRNALSEIYYIIKYLDYETRNLIPLSVCKEIKVNMNKNCIISKEDILQNNISQTAKAFLSVIYSEYLCSEEEKRKWDELDELYQLSQEQLDYKKQDLNYINSNQININIKMNNNGINNNSNSDLSINTNDNVVKNQQLIVAKPKKGIKKLIEKIKKIFKLLWR